MGTYNNSNDYYAEQRAREQAERERREKERMDRERKMRRRIVGGAIAGVLLLTTAITVARASERIKPGYVGIVYSLNGGVQPGVLTQGLKWFAPWKSVQQYSVATEQAVLGKDPKNKEDDSFDLPTSDGKTVNVDLEFSYYFDAEKLPETFTKFKGQSGRDIEKTFVFPKIKAWAGEISSTFSVLEMYGDKRATLNAKVVEHVKKKFEPYGIVIDSANFTRIGLDSQTEATIQKIINDQQALEQERIAKEKAILEAQKKQEIAKGEADALLVKTRAEAEAKMIAADGEAKANEKLQMSITPQLLQKMEAEARIKHGWVTITGGSAIAVTPAGK